MVKIYLFIIAIFLSTNCIAFEIKGVVTEQSGAPVSNALVKFVNAKDPSATYMANTNISGQYVIDETSLDAKTVSAHNMFLFCYPNPFNRQTVVSFHLDRKQRVELAVYHITGQKLRVITSGDFEEGHHQIVWDGLSHQGAPVAPGIYICSLQAQTNSSSVKMSVLGGENIATPVWSSGEESSGRKALTETSPVFHASVSGNGFTSHHVEGIDVTGLSEKNFVIDRNVWTPFSTTGDYLGIYNGTDYTPFFIKGVNLGSAIPGAHPGQMAISSEQYARWFKMIADAGFNTVRIYTLHFPRFYDEFANYNMENPDKPLYLLHGAWLTEKYTTPVAQDDLFSLTEAFDSEIKDVIDCIHGNHTIPQRYGVAYGQYKTDISPWVIGLVIGREIHAIEVGITNYIHYKVTDYTGTHVSISHVSPTEAWSAERIDRLIAYERENYSTTRPVAWSSWPTLDPIRHPSENPGSEEDDESIDLNEIKLLDAPGGYFASYHVYPYYPNFINWDEKYQNVSDDEGINNYLAYLRDLRSHYTNFPLLITEFGVPSSYGNARYSFSGMNHGGMTEEEQGKANLRMLRNIYDSNCGGGVMFSWMDEWFKRTWITNPLSSDRRKMWHDRCSPETNFGLLRFDPNPAFYSSRTTTSISSAKISKVDMWHDFTFVNLETTLKTPLSSGDTIWIAFDTYKPDTGESTLPNGQKLIKNRAEFLLRITPDSANLYVIKSYNLLGRGLIFRQLCDAVSFQTQTTDNASWQLFQWQNGTFWEEREALPFFQDIGRLNIHFGSGSLSSHQTVQIHNNALFIRIPWGMLNFSDPSNGMVVDDNQSVAICCQYFACGMQYLNASKTDEINVTCIYNGEVAELATYRWSNWETDSRDVLNPNMYIEKEKESLRIIREGLTKMPFIPRIK